MSGRGVARGVVSPLVHFEMRPGSQGRKGREAGEATNMSGAVPDLLV